MGNLHLETERLVIQPFVESDAAELATLMNDEGIACMMQTIPHPFSEKQAAEWIEGRLFKGLVGFAAKVTRKDGTLVGFVGLGGEPVNTAYAFGREHWGKGYATEAMNAFLAEVTALFALEEVIAGAFIDNLASQKVLEKLGFKRTGQKMHNATGRLEEAPLFMYRLGTSKFRTKL